MKEGWLDQLIAEAVGILKNIVISPNHCSINRYSLEEKCSILLQGFANSADMRFFEGVYRLTLPLFTWFVKRRSEEIGFPIDEERIINRMYAFLCEATLKPGLQVPTDSLFKWCYALLLNILKNESHQSANNQIKCERISLDDFLPSNADLWARSQYHSEQDRISEAVFEILYCNDADLDSNELQALTQYYKHKDLKSLSTTLGLDETKLLDLINKSRLKVLDVLFQRERFRNHLDVNDFRKEDQQ